MSYQVLARKWRPNTFAEMAGQEHVLQALINALDSDRLHHAYLFTGTRGVGKTTIARILSKCLNCEEGVSSTPCGVCNSCQEIAAGKFIDLIEVDAASRTGVDDMRELLDNVQYAPAKGRYKIYLIDEVHMLSKQSFAALLKTLEEPPPHVKFLFATTDPEKLPITVLSRCLQFNLKNLSAERITQHLQFVLEQEKLQFEESALWALARAADGSMRDALSLTDQAIGHGGGKITEPDVNAMLGTIGRGYAMEICKTLTQGQGSAVLAAVSKMAELSPDYDMVLADMLSIWHQVAILQTVPEALDKGVEHYTEMLALASEVSQEDIQLFYQVCLLGRKDLSLAPDLKSGFEMVVLRALAFRPDTHPPVKNSPESAEGATENAPEVAQSDVKKPQTDNTYEPQAQPLTSSVDQKPLADKEPSAAVNKEPSATQEPSAVVNKEPSADKESSAVVNKEASAAVNKEPSANIDREPLADKEPSAVVNKEPSVDISNEPSDNQGSKQTSHKITLQDFSPDNWLQVRKQLDIGASLGEIASHCLLAERKNNGLFFVIDNQQTSLYDSAHEQGLAQALSEYFGESVTVDIAVGVANRETPRAADNREKAERLAEAVETLNQDPDIIKFKKLFDARLDESSVRPID
jgi:DNA polymerase-3 subunit gamma/tau